MDATQAIRTAVDHADISFLFDLPLNEAQEILNSAGENTTLTKLSRCYPNVTNIEEARLIASILRSFTNIKTIHLYSQDLTGEALLPIVDSIRGHRLEGLFLSANMIGDVGCLALATLLEDPICNLHTLELQGNDIGNEGAIAIANSLVNNTKLKKLRLNNNPFNQSMVENAFSKVICNTSSVNNTYYSNHTLENLYLQRPHSTYHLSETNMGGNTGHIAIRKILRHHHPNIDMKPLFELAASVEGEQNLKGLPYVLAWFDRAKETVGYNVERRKLRAIYQFAQAMPLLFVSTSSTDKMDNKKRKRG